MAWFRRTRDDAPAAEGEAPPRAGPPSDADVIRAEGRSRAGDWMAVPTMPTTIGPPPSTFRVQRVSEIMTTRRPMAFLGSLGHRVSPSAPSGRVDGLTTTVARAFDASNQIDLPLHGRTPAPTEEPGPAAPPPSHSSSPTPSSSPSSTAAAPPAAPAVQRSVRELAPGEPVTAQTLGVAREAVPVVQRSMAAAAPAASPPAPLRSTATLPDPSPTRVLREPTRAPSILEARVPSLPVVGSSLVAPTPETSTPEGEEPPSEMAAVSTPWSDDVPAGDFVAPEQPVELVVRAAGPFVPPAVDSPLQRAVDAGAAPTTPREGTPSSDMPLAAPTAGATPSINPDGVELMPPIQPRSIQRRAETAASTVPTPASERQVGDNSLPPLPSWALAAQRQHDDLPAPPQEPPPAATSESLPLHTSRQDVVQRHASDAPLAAPAISASTDAVGNETVDDDAHDDEAGGSLQRSPDATAAAPAAAVVPASPSEQATEAAAPSAEQTAPLVGDVAVGAVEAHPLAGGTPTPGEAGPPLDLALHQSGAASRPSDDVPAPPPPSEALAEIVAADRPSDPAHDVEAAAIPTPGADVTIAPLLGDRPLALQRTAASASGAPLDRSASPDQRRPGDLPLVVDPGSGPALPPASDARTGPTRPLAPGASVQRMTTSGFGGGVASGLAAGTPAAGSGSSQGAPTPVQRISAPLHGPAATPTPTADPRGTMPLRDLSPLPLAVTDAPERATPWVGPPSLPLAVQTLPATPASRAATPTPAMPLHEPGRADAGGTLGDAAVAAGVAQRLDDGSVVFTGLGAVAGEQGGVSLPIQRLADPGLPPTGSDAAPAAVQRVETTAAPSQAGSDPAAEQKQNDELADKVYDRIRWKLESDLFAERWRVNAGAWSRRER